VVPSKQENKKIMRSQYSTRAVRAIRQIHFPPAVVALFSVISAGTAGEKKQFPCRPARGRVGIIRLCDFLFLSDASTTLAAASA
jgi:hypothetical protein